jgi:hypothetical protein
MDAHNQKKREKIKQRYRHGDEPLATSSTLTTTEDNSRIKN